MNRDIKVRLIELLSELQAYRSSDDGTEHTVRCPYCGDSDTQTHSHFGIKIDPNNDEGMPFHCFRCDISGQLTPAVLDDLGIQITDDEYREFKAFTKKAAKLKKRNTLVVKENFTVPLSEYSPQNEQKRIYLAERLGLAFSYEELQENRIVPSLLEFMVRNEIKAIQGFDATSIHYLDEKYVGFLSINNNMINFRCIDPNFKGKRYIKIILNPDNTSNANFYSLPVRLDLLSPKPIHVHIAEGPFDILSVRFNLNPEAQHPEANHIYFSGMGFGFNGIIRHLIRGGILGNLNLHIYADHDKKDYEEKRILKKGLMNAFVDHFYIHRNQFHGEKDYGVPLSNIVDGVRKMW